MDYKQCQGLDESQQEVNINILALAQLFDKRKVLTLIFAYIFQSVAADKFLRHCSVCLKVCSPAKLCGKCKKRPYCSRECQLIDWPPKGKGQGHKNWFHLDCGEEDIDWEVKSIPGKGLGIVAKKEIPPLYRIIVEPVFTDPKQHPGK